MTCRLTFYTLIYYQVNKKIRVDEKTGEYFELGRLPPNQFERIMKETKAIQVTDGQTFEVSTHYRTVFTKPRFLLNLRMSLIS